MSYTLINLFKGDSIYLTAKRPEDAEIMTKWQEDSDYLTKMDTDFAVPSGVSAHKANDANDSKNQNHVHFRIRSLEDDRLIGFAALHSIEWNCQSASLAIGIGDPMDRGNGYGTEALELLVRYAFWELNLHRVGLDVISYNTAAIRSYEKAGFQQEGRMRDAVFRQGKRYDRIMMSLLKPDWKNKITQKG